MDRLRQFPLPVRCGRVPRLAHCRTRPFFWPIRASSWNQISTVGSILLGLSTVTFIYNVWRTAKRAERVTVAMTWEADIYAEWSVTFVWREREDGALEYRPISMGFRTR